MELVLVGLGDCSQRVQMAQKLNSVVRLDVVHAVAEHLQQGVQDAPRMRLEDGGQELTYQSQNPGTQSEKGHPCIYLKNVTQDVCESYYKHRL